MKNKISQINALAVPAFTELLGGVFEHSPWIAERAAAKRPFADRAALPWGHVELTYDFAGETVASLTREVTYLRETVARLRAASHSTHAAPAPRLRIHKLLPAIDIVNRPRQRRIRHDMHRQSRDVVRHHNAPDRHRGPKLIPPVIEFFAQQRCR